ncbi:MAG TPA: metallophosphoesterase [Vicinamibacterales bacterium]|jgi:hypothetical protein
MTFFAIILSVWTLEHVYVVARLWNLPPAAGPLWHRALLIGGALLWVSFPLGQILARSTSRTVAAPVELVGATWVGMLFFLFAWLLGADIVTGFGWLIPGLSRPLRLAAVAIAIGLSLFAVTQGLRAPTVQEHRVAIQGLPPALAGLRIVQLSDLHLGPVLRKRWIEERITQVEQLRPDLIVVTGDLVDQDSSLSELLVPSLRTLHAPLGVWGVTGNHEFYAGLDGSLRVFADAGIRLLRDTSVEVAPGLVLAGVDDLTARRQFGQSDHPVDRTLAHRPPGSTVFLCHSPWQVERAAQLGVGLMLSGHTHDGQIWPFTYLVRMVYPYVAGRYAIDGMSLIVSRGTGFWGPPMRLFRRGEIVAITVSPT